MGGEGFWVFHEVRDASDGVSTYSLILECKILTSTAVVRQLDCSHHGWQLGGISSPMPS
jgi:hypothetical protein